MLIAMDIKRKVNFELLPYGKNNNYYRIRIGVSYPGHRIYLPTGCNIRSIDGWDEINHLFIKGYESVKGEKSDVQNKELIRLTGIIDKCFKMHEVNDTIPTPAQIKEYYHEHYNIKRQIDEAIDEEIRADLKPLAFWTIYEEFLEDNGAKNAWSASTLNKFYYLKNDLTNYKKKIEFEDITEKWLTGFVCFLRDKKYTAPAKSLPDEHGKRKGEKIGLKNDSIKKKLCYLRWFLKWATAKGYNSSLAYQTFKPTLKSTNNPVVFLTKEELNAINSLELPETKKYLERVRDVFMFCCFSGLRYSDALNLKKSDIKNSKIMITTVKTGDSISIELNDVTKQILNKYKDYPLENNKALPVITNQKMNSYVKELCFLAGIDEPIRITNYRGSKRIDEVQPKYRLIGTHTGRRTFICQMLSLGVPAEIVMKWTGHSDYSAMKPYIAIVDQAKAAQMTKINVLLQQ